MDDSTDGFQYCLVASDSCDVVVHKSSSELISKSQVERLSLVGVTSKGAGCYSRILLNERKEVRQDRIFPKRRVTKLRTDKQ